MQPTEKTPTYPDLDGKVALVTGGSGGIGGATCRALAAGGVRVAVNGRDPGRVSSMVQDITAAGGQAIGVPGDCTDLAAVERIRERVEADLGAVDLLAAFVGTGRARPGPLAETPVEDWQSTVDGCLTATFLTLKVFLPGMVERGSGAVVTMASSAARVLTPASAAYAAAKAGVIQLTRQVAGEVGPRGVRVNCLVPHTVLVPRLEGYVTEEWRQQLIAAVPLRRLGTPEDVALAALFLLSDSAAWITGVTLDVAGGHVMA